MTYQILADPSYEATATVDIIEMLNVVQMEKPKNVLDAISWPPMALSTSLVPALKRKKSNQQCLQSTWTFPHSQVACSYFQEPYRSK